MNPFPQSVTITTDDTLRETQPHGSGGYPFAYYLEDIWKFDFHCIDWHWHHELEFLSVTEGTAICLIGKDRIALPAGYGLFINSGVLHRFEAASSAIIPNIVFSPSLLAEEKSLVYENYVRPVIGSAVAYQVLDPDIPWQRQALAFLAQIYETQKETEGPVELRTLRLLLSLWELFAEHLDLTRESAAFHGGDARQARLQVMMQYIHDHYPENITLEEIAASASVSKSGALHIFQAGIHLAPVSYLIRYRLHQASVLLSTTKKPVSLIAEETGFTSAGYFCRKFKERYQKTPGEYRLATPVFRQRKSRSGRPPLR